MQEDVPLSEQGEQVPITHQPRRSQRSPGFRRKFGMVQRCHRTQTCEVDGHVHQEYVVLRYVYFRYEHVEQIG